MRLFIAVILLMSFSAMGQRVRENIKQQSGESSDKVRPEKPIKSVKSVKPIRR